MHFEPLLMMPPPPNGRLHLLLGWPLHLTPRAFADITLTAALWQFCIASTASALLQSSLPLRPKSSLAGLVGLHLHLRCLEEPEAEVASPGDKRTALWSLHHSRGVLRVSFSISRPSPQIGSKKIHTRTQPCASPNVPLVRPR